MKYISFKYCICILVITIFTVGLCAVSVSETLEQVINPKKVNNNWVSDMANVIGDSEKQSLNATISQLEKKTSAEIAVVTVRNTGNLIPKDFATKLLNLWGIGKKDKDNGVLVLLATDDRRIEVETGYGVEGLLPDGKIGGILDNNVVPEFKQGEFGKGLLAGVQAMADVIAKGESAESQPVPAEPVHLRSSFLGWIIVFVWIVFLSGFVTLAIYIIRRSRVRYCKQCGQKMRRLTEEQDDAYLSYDQRVEEGLGSVNYKVWRCDSCQISTIERSIRHLSKYEDCPKCKHRTVYVSSYVLKEPTYEREGLEEIKRVCRFPKCDYSDVEDRETPRRIRPSTATAITASTIALSSESSGSGGSSGGFNGSSSGGGSSGGGSFGGGSSGGGGAGRSW